MHECSPLHVEAACEHYGVFMARLGALESDDDIRIRKAEQLVRKLYVCMYMCVLIKRCLAKCMYVRVCMCAYAYA